MGHKEPNWGGSYPPKKYISGFEFAIPVEMRTPWLKSSGFSHDALSKNEPKTEFWSDCELTQRIAPSFESVFAT